MPEQRLGLGKTVQVLQKGVVLFEDILICETIDINTCKQSIVASAQHSTAQQQGISAVRCMQHDSGVGGAVACQNSCASCTSLLHCTVDTPTPI